MIRLSTMRLADDDPALVIHDAGGVYARGLTTRCLGRERDGSDRASAEAMAARLVATGVTEIDHPIGRCDLTWRGAVTP